MSQYSYSIYRFVPDPLRNEAVNIGVVVVSDEDRVSHGEFLSRFRSRVRALTPDANIETIEQIIDTFRLQFGTAFQQGLGGGEDQRITSTEQLSRLAANRHGQFQLTEPKRYRAESLAKAARRLYALYVSPQRKPPPPVHGMTLRRLKSIIRSTIRTWGGDAVRIQEKGLERGREARHFADFWVEAGEPVAALIAIPDDPGERFEAWARRDSIPTIAEEFLSVNPSFRTVAVFPPNGHGMTSFVEETMEFLTHRTGVLVLHADQLAEYRQKIVPQLL